MPRLERLSLVVLLLAAACSKKPAQNYRHCLKLRIGMTREQLISVMGEPEDAFPYVEGKSLPHLQGHTAFEWSTPSTMSAPNHVSIEDATGKVESIRCGDSTVNTVFVIEPSSAPDAAAAVPAAATAPPSPDGLLLPGSIVISIGTGPTIRRTTVSLGSGKYLFQSQWLENDVDRMLEINGNATAAANGATDLEYELSYSYAPPASKMIAVQNKGRVTVTADGEVELTTTPDGPVKLSSAKDAP